MDLKIDELENPEYSGIVDRAEKRIEEAIDKALVSEPQRNDEIEILSFPIAVMMVSTTKDAFLKRRYALAEAKRAYGLLKRESKDKLIQIATVLNWKVRKAKPDTSDFTLHFTDYLRNTTSFHESKWKLINRAVYKGEVHLSQDETARLLAEEVRRHVEKKLETQIEFELPKAIESRVEKLSQLFQSARGKMHLKETPKEVVFEAFPPCIRELRNSALAGRHMSHI